MITVIIFILILGLLVFVHELGHFLIARRNGVAAEEFGFGFPPRILGLYKNHEGHWKFIFGSRNIKTKNTIYSVNWIPLGGFVKIMGEDGEQKENPQSFAAKSPFTRVRILAAGVLMNFLLAALLFSLGFYLGVPQAADEVKNAKVADEKIQIVEVGKNTPAESMGIRLGDVILGARDENNLVKFSSVEEVQGYIDGRKGQSTILEISRGKNVLDLSGIPRQSAPSGEGPLGIGLAKIVIAKYAWHEALWLGVRYTWDLTLTFVSILGIFLWKLVAGKPQGLDVSGPVGIAVLTGEVAQLGFSYLIRFAALLSVNLAIINILPIPALDGGRILFILIEKLKGSPIKRETELRVHNIGFALLITLMLFVTVRDLMKFDIIEKVKHIF